LGKSFEDLKNDVIKVGLCTGCGTCVGVCPSSALAIDYEADEPEPKVVGTCNSCGLCYEVCPGKDIPLPELDKFFLGRERDFEKEKIGIFKACYRGYATNPLIRERSSSGGLVSALLIYALEEGIIDAALLAGWRKDKAWRCEPFIATNSNEILKGIRTGMMMVPNNALLSKAVEEGYKKIAVVGVPCHVHGIRKLQMLGRPKKIAEAIKLVLGLFCASTYYMEGTRHLLEEIGGIKTDEIIAMDYRGGDYPGALYVLTQDGKIHYVASKHMYTWHFLGSATYKRDRCLMCVDFSSELADLSFGDTFLRFDEPNPRIGVVLTRTEIGHKLLMGAAEKKYVEIKEYDPELIPVSGMGWESKKHAGVYRLLQRQKYGWPVPNYHYKLSESPLRRKLIFPKE